MSCLCADGAVRELLQKIGSQAEVVQQSAERVSSTAEVYGAVQQEARIARAVEIMLLHVENLKRMNEREHTELEESRKVLAANNLSIEDQWRASLDVTASPKIGRPNSRGRSVSVIHPKQGSPTNTLGDALVRFLKLHVPFKILLCLYFLDTEFSEISESKCGNSPTTSTITYIQSYHQFVNFFQQGTKIVGFSWSVK